VWYQWPNDTEYQTAGVTGPPVIPPSRLGLSFHGFPNEGVSMLYALGPLCPGVPIGVIDGLLWLNPASLNIITGLGSVGSNGLLNFTGTMGSLTTPQRFSLWLQGYFVTLGSKRLGNRSDPLMVF
jgi:hypothetical protein